MDLLAWCSNYIDYRNAFLHDLLEKKKEGQRIECNYKTKGHIAYIIHENLDESVFKVIENGSIYLVCLNTKDNLSFLIKHWDKFIKNEKLVMFFANPQVNMHWPLIPYKHNMVTEPSSLKTGLKSISDAVPLV